jgi:hypothetical protein
VKLPVFDARLCVTAENNRQSFTVVRSRAVQLRLRAMRSQLIAASSLCFTAENAVALDQVQLGLDAVQKAKHTAQSVRVHLDEPHHIPADSVAAISDQLAELEKRISKVEARFHS